MSPSLANKSDKRSNSGFTLIEVLISFTIFGMVVSGLIYGYVQINRIAEWCSMSLAAQSYASEGLEQAKSAQWDSEMAVTTWGPGTGDELGFPASVGHTNYYRTNTMDVPTTGAPIMLTNFIFITNISTTPPLRMIRSDCVWTFPFSGKPCTNTVITCRAPDQ